MGNEVSGDNALNILPAMLSIHAALLSAGLSIKVTTSVSMSVLGTSYPPSHGEFSSDSSYMTPIVQYLAVIDAPLLVNVHPYFTYVGNQADISLDYALFTSLDYVVIDGPYKYRYLFDAMVDAVYSAMEKVDGGSNVRVVVSETGWPSGGGDAATVQYARIYNQLLIMHVSQGTPKKPTPLETYIFAMFNENQKPAGVEQNWGLFHPDKTPVYPITFL
jgi:Glycosyl hydrolases family 17